MRRALLLATWLFCGPGWGWNSPVELQPTVAPMRTLSLPASMDATQWAQQQGLSQWQSQTGAEGRQQLSFRADDDRWQQLQRQCDGTNPLAPQCANDSCQGVRGLEADRSQAWLTPRAPDLNALLAGQPDSCPANLESQPWNGRWPEGSDPACWSLQQALPCQSEQTPGEYLQPHWRLDQLVVLLPAGAGPIEPLVSTLGLSVLEQTPLKSTGEQLVRLLRPASSATSLDGWVDVLGNMASVLSVQKDLAYFTLADSAPALAQPDPLDPFNYAPAMTAVDRLAQVYGGEGIEVAVIDTGVDDSHPELTAAVVERLDLSGRGWSADAHGTGVAAIIAAARGNGIGAAGIAPAVKIHSFKACQPRQSGGLAAQCWSSSLVKALDEAISRNIPIINMSLGGPPSPLMKRLVDLAAERGLLVVAAAGNGGPNAHPVYPAAWPAALAVTAVGPDKQLYRHANRGAYIGLAAPGVDIITAGPGNGQPILSGTSMAAAHVSGAAALLLQLSPGMRAADLAPMLKLHGQDLGEPGPDGHYGAGLINACDTGLELADLLSLCGGGL